MMMRSSLAHWRWIPLLLALAALLVGCTGLTDPNATTDAPGSTTTAVPCAANCTPGVGIQEATLVVQPDAKAAPVVNAIRNAQHSVNLEIYLLTETNVIHALEDAANRGVNVQVMLEAHPVGSGSVTPQETLAALNAAGVKAQPANPTFALTHAKLLLIDGQTAYISTGNFTKTALGGSSASADRDYLIVDTNAADVAECNAIFAADWGRTTPQVSDPNLVVSPVNARAKLLSLINGAKQSLHIEEEEMKDAEIIAALGAAAQRGVNVQVVVPKPTSSNNSDAKGEQELMNLSVHVVQVNDRVGHNPYIHAKIIIADGTLAYVGSVNVSAQSMNRNREVGVLVANANVIQQLDASFAQDYGSGTSPN